MQAFDVNMNPTAGPGAEGVLPVGLSTIQGQVSGFNGQFMDVKEGLLRKLQTRGITRSDLFDEY